MPIIFILLWSSGYIFAEMGLETNSPLSFVMVRLFFSVLSLAIFIFFKRGVFLYPVKKMLHMGVTGIFLQGFYQLFAFSAMYQQVSPGVLAIILGAQPIVTAVMTKELMTPSQMTGLILGLTGLGLTVSNTLFSGTTTAMGVFSCFLSLFGITVGTILQKKYCSTLPLTTNLFTQYVASFIFIGIGYLLFDNQPIQWSGQFIIALSWMIFVISLASTFLFYFLLKTKAIVNFTSYLYCVPPVTAVMDYCIFHRALPTVSVIGLVMVMFSLWLILHKKNDRSAVDLVTDKQ